MKGYAIISAAFTGPVFDLANDNPVFIQQNLGNKQMIEKCFRAVAGLSSLMLVASPAFAHPGHGELGILHHVMGGDYWFVALGAVVVLALVLVGKRQS
jgi:hypothetical protein